MLTLTFLSLLIWTFCFPNPCYFTRLSDFLLKSFFMYCPFRYYWFPWLRFSRMKIINILSGFAFSSSRCWSPFFKLCRCFLQAITPYGLQRLFCLICFYLICPSYTFLSGMISSRCIHSGWCIILSGILYGVICAYYTSVMHSDNFIVMQSWLIYINWPVRIWRWSFMRAA